MHEQVERSRSLLLQRMNLADFELMEPHLESVRLDLRASLEKAGEEIQFVYFVESGLASVVASTGGGYEAEVGVIGFEGMTGSALIMGDHQATHDCFVQMTCEALRMQASAFVAVLSQSNTLRTFLLRYVHALHLQTTYTALLNVRCTIDERLARWLLMCADRVIGNRLAITHAFLSIMLGVRRPGVTLALQILEGQGLIQARRGEVTIRDRAGLLALAGPGYGPPEAQYRRLVTVLAPG
ncbi:Crp/Fnr family transcriptional regulator [Mesorhizobium sp. B2-5-7]|uniref:Crp/Fnr family transcriptional regulator n=1 Tax=Mesorhizobium sp. B2-5-7 TaxID=2589923 RepID=UPI0011285DD1|nr:Crp/Fnr family transcriptional regulator [Mesorhizobium sp. B2-5-7]TPK10447.1 Crp/Fnr family transcriptional regulator [Mesorhizobium sp. B2-5-7]